MSQVGVAIVGVDVCGVVVRRSRVIRFASITSDSTRKGSQLRDDLDRVLTELALPRSRRRPAVIALGQTHLQTRHLTHLPAVSDPSVLASVLQTNVGRFFRKNGKALVISSPEITNSCEAWASAIEAPLLEELRATFGLHGFQLRAVIPAVIAVGVTTNDPALAWVEQHIRIEASYTAQRRLAQLRLAKATAPAFSNAPCRPTLRPELKTSGMPNVASIALLAAFGATLESLSEPFWIRVSSRTPSSAPSLKRVLIAAVAMTLGLLAMSIAPIAATHKSATAAQTRLRITAREERVARSTIHDLSQTTVALSQLATFSQRRRSAVLLLQSFADALPDSAWVESIHFDELGGSLVALSPDAAEVLASLDSVQQVINASIVGTVSPVTLNGEHLERVTITYQWKGERPSASAQTVGRAAR